MPHLYITHAEVTIDPDVPMPRWGLNEIGRARVSAFAARGLLPTDAIYYASDEQKALDTAELLAGANGDVRVDAAFGENDRSATGYLAPAAFEAMVERLFATPEAGPDGWESASHAQARVVAAVHGALATHPAGRQAVFVGHGCVGTLLKCHVGGRAIARHEDQRVMAAKGGGNVFAFELEPKQLIGDWQALEDFGGTA